MKLGRNNKIIMRTVLFDGLYSKKNRHNFVYDMSMRIYDEVEDLLFDPMWDFFTESFSQLIETEE